MLRFFRPLRHRLLSENRASRYMLYALGEIALVVVGILIALQVNNWNEDQKAERETETYLNALRQELQNNIRYLRNVNNFTRQDIRETLKYMEAFSVSGPVEDTIFRSVASHIGPINLTPMAEAAFNELMNSGAIQNVADDSLKYHVERIESYLRVFEKRKAETDATWQSQLLPYYMEHANIISMRDSIMEWAVPKTTLTPNRDAFVNNRQFLNLLMNRSMMNWRLHGSNEQIIEQFESLVSRIDRYLVEKTKPK